MEACCAAQVGHVQLMNELVAERRDCRNSDEGEMLSWPLQPVTCEDSLPPVHGQSGRRRQRSSQDSGGKFPFLPSVGTWLLPLPRKLVTDASEPTPAKSDMQIVLPKKEGKVPPIAMPVKAEIWTGYYTSTWTACEIRLRNDRIDILDCTISAGPEAATELMKLWLSELPKTAVQVDGRTIALAALAQVRCKGASEASLLAVAIRSAAERLVSKIHDRKWSFVFLNVYDLFNWQMSIFNNVTWLLGAGGAYHAAVEVYGVEYAFGGTECGIGGSGITTCTPKSCRKHSFSESLCLGVTTMSAEEVEQLMVELAPEWLTQDYEVLGPNCITFCRHMCSRLGVADVPDWVDAMARSIKERNVIFDPSTGSANYKGRSCPQQHSCKLQSQGFLAGFVEVVICSSCECEIEPGLQHWHCSECDESYCKNCLVPPAL